MSAPSVSARPPAGTNGSLDKHGQLMVIVIGFFSTVQLLIAQTRNGAAPLATVAVTLALALACAIRYWWVILLLPWPFRWFRMVLLLLAWCTLPLAAAMTTDPLRWALALAALSAIGCMTEIYNGVTRQWAVGPEGMAGALKADHIAGAASAGVAAVVLLLIALSRSEWLDVLIPLMVFADWVRLIMMIRRHQRFLELERPT